LATTPSDTPHKAQTFNKAPSSVTNSNKTILDEPTGENIHNEESKQDSMEIKNEEHDAEMQLCHQTSQGSNTMDEDSSEEDPSITADETPLTMYLMKLMIL
jgi:hypothetical protein